LLDAGNNIAWPLFHVSDCEAQDLDALGLKPFIANGVTFDLLPLVMCRTVHFHA
jgi:hypothetical protein